MRQIETISSEVQCLSKKGRHEVQKKVNKDVHNCLRSSHLPLVHTLPSDSHTSHFEIMVPSARSAASNAWSSSAPPLPSWPTASSSSRSSYPPQGDDVMVRNNFAHMQRWGANTASSASSPLPPLPVWSPPPAPSLPSLSSNPPEDDDYIEPESKDEILDYLFSLFDPMAKVEVLTQIENWGGPCQTVPDENMLISMTRTQRTAAAATRNRIGGCCTAVLMRTQ
jgi:hypothetical protein